MMKNIQFLIQQKNMKVSGRKLDQKLKGLMAQKKFFKKNIFEDDLPLEKSLKLLTLIVNINLVFQSNNKLYLQIFLDERFYEL